MILYNEKNCRSRGISSYRGLTVSIYYYEFWLYFSRSGTGETIAVVNRHRLHRILFNRAFYVGTFYGRCIQKMSVENYFILCVSFAGCWINNNYLRASGPVPFCFWNVSRKPFNWGGVFVVEKTRGLIATRNDNDDGVT